MWLWTILLAFIGYMIWKFYILPKRVARFYENQGIPMTYAPFIGEFFSYFKDVDEHSDFYYKWKLRANQIPKIQAFGTNLHDSACINLLDPELLKEFLTKHDQYIKHPEIFSIYKTILGDGLIMSEGRVWKKSRKVVSLAFHWELLKSMIPEVVQVTLETFKNIIKEKRFSDFNAIEGFQVITGEVVGRIFFGEKFSQNFIDGKSPTTFLADLIIRSAKTSQELTFGIFGIKFVKAGILAKHRKLLQDTSIFLEFCKKIVSNKELEFRKAKILGNPKSTRKNMLEMFFEQREQKHEDSLTDDEIVAEFTNFFLAGMDTTGHLVAMATYYFVMNPDTRKPLLAEIKEYLNNSNDISIELLNKMDYLTAFLKETLRMATPAPSIMHRVALSDHKLGNLEIKKGTTITATFMGNNFSEEYFDEPEKFKPDRFYDKNSITNTNLAKNPYVFLPFSAGGRNCIGQHLAMNEAKIIFGLFVKTFNFDLQDPNYKLKMNQTFMHEPKDPLVYRLEPKNQQNSISN